MTKLRNAAVVCEFAPGVIRNLFGVWLAQRSADEGDNLNNKNCQKPAHFYTSVFFWGNCLK